MLPHLNIFKIFICKYKEVRENLSTEKKEGLTR